MNKSEAKAKALVAQYKKADLALERIELSQDFGKFFREAWKEQLEPYSEFNDSPHYALLFEYAQLIGTKGFKRRFPDKKGLVVCIPPRSSKSKIFNVALPAWIWTFAPWTKFLCLSYGQDLATPLSQERRNLIQSKWYQRHWKLEIREDANEKRRYDTPQGGMCFSSGTVATGVGGNLIICDDMLNARYAYSKAIRQSVNNFWDDALTTRRNNPAEDVYLIVMQRLHSNDLVGHLLNKEKDEWVVINIQMEAEEDTEYVFPISGKVWKRKKGDTLIPKMFDRKFIEGEKKNPRKWTAQFQQHPSPPGGFIFDPDKWKFYDPSGKMPDPEFQVMSVDCTWKSGKANDKVAVQVWGVEGPNKFLLWRKHEHMSYVDTLEAIREGRRLFPKVSVVLVERAANGEAVIKQLSEEMPGMVGVLAQDSKEARAQAASADLESGHCFIPDPEKDASMQSSWIDVFAQFQGDGSVEWDDEIDAFSQCINWLRSRFWGVDHLDKVYADLQRRGEAGPVGDTCPGCGKDTVTREGSAWACSACPSHGRGSSVSITKAGF